jgi:hypothetical protein
LNALTGVNSRNVTNYYNMPRLLKIITLLTHRTIVSPIHNQSCKLHHHFIQDTYTS